MAYTRKDTGDGCYGQNSLSQSEATPQPYSPEQEQHANAPPPPHCVLAVSVLQVFAFLSNLTILLSRLHLPCTVPAISLNGMRPRCTRVLRPLRINAMACLCHISTMWPAAIVVGLTRSRALRSFLKLLWQLRALLSLEHSRWPKSFFI